MIDWLIDWSGRVLADKLVKEGIETTYILLTALTQVLAGVTKVVLLFSYLQTLKKKKIKGTVTCKSYFQ